jgi:hypothetical protein
MHIVKPLIKAIYIAVSSFFLSIFILYLAWFKADHLFTYPLAVVASYMLVHLIENSKFTQRRKIIVYIVSLVAIAVLTIAYATITLYLTRLEFNARMDQLN